MSTIQVNPGNREFYEKVLIPYVTGALSLFVAPTIRRYFKENPIQNNPNNGGVCQMYWEGSSRSSIALAAGMLSFVIPLSNSITSGLEKAIIHKDFSELIGIGVGLGTPNMISGFHEIKKKNFN